MGHFSGPGVHECRMGGQVTSNSVQGEGPIRKEVLGSGSPVLRGVTETDAPGPSPRNRPGHR